MQHTGNKARSARGTNKTQFNIQACPSSAGHSAAIVTGLLLGSVLLPTIETPYWHVILKRISLVLYVVMFVACLLFVIVVPPPPLPGRDKVCAGLYEHFVNARSF